MAFSVTKGSFAAKTSTGTQAITGVGFQPKAVILFWERITAAGFNAANISGGMGMFTSATDCAVTAWGINDAAAANSASGSYGYFNAGTYCCLMMSDATPTYARYCSPVSMDADGFTITWAVADANAVIVHYLALGGTTLTNAKVASGTTGGTTGNRASTGVGFQPDALFFMARRDDGVANPYADVGIGAALSSTNRAFAYFGTERAASPTNVYQAQGTTKTLIIPKASGGGVVGSKVADFVSMDADGFTLNWTTNDGSNPSQPFAYLALKGGNYQLGVETQKTSTGTKATTGVGFAPAGLFLFGANHTSTVSDQTDKRRISIGAASSPGVEGCIWDQSVDNVATTQTSAATVTDKVLRHATADSTTDAEADVATIDSDGFTLNWTTADATAREFVYFAVGPGTATPPTTVSASDSATATEGTTAVVVSVAEPAIPTLSHAASSVMGMGSAGSWDDYLVYNPRIVKNIDGISPYRDANGYYYIYYSGSGNTVGTDRDRIGLYRTLDWVTFTKYSVSGPVMGWGPSGTYDESGTVWDGTDVSATTVIHDGTKFIMYFEGNRFSNAHGDQVEIGVATSTDGLTWTKDAGNPIVTRGAAGTGDAEDVYAFSVIKDGSTWKAWYTGHDSAGNYRVMHATASAYNGPWTKYSTAPIYNGNNFAGVSQVWKSNGVYYMALDDWSGLATVKLLASPDGINWVERRTLISATGSGWDGGRIYWTDRVRDGGTWRTVYTGATATTFVYGMGYVGQSATGADVGSATDTASINGSVSQTVTDSAALAESASVAVSALPDNYPATLEVTDSSVYVLTLGTS